MTFEHEIIQTYLNSLKGMTISDAWNGFSSFICLEIGELGEREGFHTAKGEASAAFEFDWSLENDHIVECGAHSSTVDIKVALSGLQGLTIVDVTLIGLPPELQMTFSDGRRLRSCTLSRGYPEWHVFLKGDLYLSAEPGVIDPSFKTDRWSEEEPDDQALQVIKQTAERWRQYAMEPVNGDCQDCSCFVKLNGYFDILDYGVCTNEHSSHDGRAVHCKSGCQFFRAD